MRFLPAVVMSIVLAAPSTAALAGAPAAGRSVSWRPHAWRPPVSAPGLVAGVRSDPLEAGLPIAPDLASAMAAHRAALAAVPVVHRADGSRSAVLGGLARRWTVARIGDDGVLHESCVTTEAEARSLVDAAGKERAK